MLSAISCIAIAIYFEAGNQNIEGMLAVGNVIMNRVNSAYYPNNPCDVVTQGKYVAWSSYPLKYQCQFTFWCDGKSDEPDDLHLYITALVVASMAMLPSTPDLTYGANHYHAKYVSPHWARLSNLTTIIGDHIFYEL